MKDFLVLKRGHIYLPGYRPALQQSLHFIEKGNFSAKITEPQRKTFKWTDFRKRSK